MAPSTQPPTYTTATPLPHTTTPTPPIQGPTQSTPTQAITTTTRAIPDSILSPFAQQFVPSGASAYRDADIEKVAEDIAKQLKEGAPDHPIFRLAERALLNLSPSGLPQRTMTHTKHRPASLSSVSATISLLPPSPLGTLPAAK